MQIFEETSLSGNGPAVVLDPSLLFDDDVNVNFGRPFLQYLSRFQLHEEPGKYSFYASLAWTFQRIQDPRQLLVGDKTWTWIWLISDSPTNQFRPYCVTHYNRAHMANDYRGPEHFMQTAGKRMLLGLRRLINKLKEEANTSHQNKKRASYACFRAEETEMRLASLLPLMGKNDTEGYFKWSPE